MKKLLLSAFAVCAFAFTSNAQDSDKSSSGLDVTFGAKAGVNLANMAGDIEDNDMKVGFHVGGMAELAFSDKFAVQPELVFSTQGYQYDVADETVKANFSYINLPVMAKYFVTEGLSLEAGPQVGFLVDAQYKADGDSLDIDDASSVDFGMNFGAGYKLDNGLNFSARYNLGLSNTYDGPGKDDYKVSNTVIQFSVGYFFN